MTAPAGNIRVAIALAPGEARRIVRSVAFLLFLPLSIMALATASEFSTLWSLASIEAALGLVPLAWCLLVLTDLAVLRDKRHGVDVLTDTMPATATARTGGHLIGGFVGVPVGMVLIAIFTFLPPSRSGSPDWLELAVPLLLVAGGAVVGVAVARWLPSAIFTVPAIIVTIFITGKIGEARVGRTRFLGFVTNSTPTGVPALDGRPTALHLVWLLAWIGIMAVVALLRYDRSPRLVGSAVVLVALAVLAGVGQVKPIDAETAAARADFLNRPVRHQVCIADDGVDYCAYPTNAENTALWMDTVRAVRAHLPASLRRRELTVAQRVPQISGNSNCGQTATLDQVDAPIKDRVSVLDAWPADGQVHPGIASENLPCGGTGLKGLFTGVQVGAWAVGLPPAQWRQGIICAADGQARSAIALWLGTANGGRLSTFFDNVSVRSKGRVDTSDWDDPPTWGVDWHASDIRAALAMTELPDEQVDQVLAAHWDELVAPDTPTARLLDLLDLPRGDAVGEPLDDCPKT